MSYRVIVIISGGGSNLSSIINSAYNYKVVSVISNKLDAGGLQIAKDNSIPTIVIDHTKYSERELFDKDLAKAIRNVNPDLIALAGFMRILGNEFVAEFSDKLINIHPSLLPKYTGLNTHQRAINAGDVMHGATVHSVVDEIDCGPGIIQAEVPIKHADTPSDLAHRVLDREHLIYPLAVKLFAEKRLVLSEHRIFFEGEELTTPIRFAYTDAIDIQNF